MIYALIAVAIILSLVVATIRAARAPKFRSSHESQFLNSQRTSNGTYHGYFYSKLIR